ncbi:MAG: PSD1 and planctomycete cytochrome C domain-containing protein, partial [Planctomycetota bacterium]|nr:PSD1 and planctomycete cytochrome C domain-containing protein [Planctomycetota bacterium]
MLVLTSLTVTCSVAAADDVVNFSSDIRPLLSGKCFSCHGPDDDARKGDLRLDSFEAATADSSGTAAVVAGKSLESELVRRILSDDPDERMPPASSNRSLSPEQKQLLIRWIDSGAQYERHWAFVPPILAAPPEEKHGGWARTEIDRFIVGRLNAAGLSPSPDAEPRTLLRRVYLDLIGLPPSSEEADQWLARLVNSEGRIDDASYEGLVNHLLGLPQYGERWARRWLDLARYADTNGYEKDRDRTMWPYRDWVIHALNADMPFDQFTVEQIAGDMLPDATNDQRIATGFHRNTMLNEEGGIDPLEFRFYAMTDRVATTGTTWLGLTTGCCQCHTHKYDPITHRDYYSLMAFLNNADEPDLNLPDPAAEQRYQTALVEANRLLDELPGHWPVENPEDRAAVIEKAFAEWLSAARMGTPDWQVMRPARLTSNLPQLTLEDDGSVFAGGDTTVFDTYDLQFDDIPEGATALRLEALPDRRLPAHGPGTTYYEGRKGDFFLNEFALTLDEQPVTFESASHSYAKNQFGKNPVSAQLTIDGDYQTGWSAAERPGERSVSVYVLQKPLPAGKHLQLKMTFGRHFASSLGRFRVSAAMSNVSPIASDRTVDVERLLRLPEDQLSDVQRALLFGVFLLEAPEVAKHARRIRDLRRRPAPIDIPVLSERPSDNPRPTFRHKRGEYLQPAEVIEGSVPKFLHELPVDAARDRLEFARWLVSRENPLTARVVVNRHWAAFFGTGIVKTLDDFGMQGESPSHPQLLDWLAVEFMNDDWSMKKLHRRIVLSSTYRQSSNTSLVDSSLSQPAVTGLSPSRLLARFPRARLEAELIRDSILHAAGLLSLKSGGPPVRPPQPGGVSEAAYGSPKWNASSGEDRYRRSIFTYQKRTAPFAMFST